MFDYRSVPLRDLDEVQAEMERQTPQLMGKCQQVAEECLSLDWGVLQSTEKGARVARPQEMNYPDPPGRVVTSIGKGFFPHVEEDDPQVEGESATAWVASQKKRKTREKDGWFTPQKAESHQIRIMADEAMLTGGDHIPLEDGFKDGRLFHQQEESYRWITCPPKKTREGKVLSAPDLPPNTIRDKRTPHMVEEVDEDGTPTKLRVRVVDRMVPTPPSVRVPDGFRFTPLEEGPWHDPTEEGGNDNFWGGLTPHEGFLQTIDPPERATTPPEEVSWRETSEITPRQWGGVGDEGPPTKKGLAE